MVPDTSLSPLHRVWTGLQARAAPAGVLIYQLVILVAMTALPFLNYDWISAGGSTTFWVLYPLGWVFFLSSLWLYQLRRSDPVGRNFALFSAAAAFSLSGAAAPHTYQFATWLWCLSVSLAGGALVSLALVFPEEVTNPVHPDIFRRIGFIPSVVIGITALPAVLSGSSQSLDRLLSGASLAYVALGLILLLLRILWKRITSSSPLIRSQSRMFLWGYLLSFLPVTVWSAFAFMRPEFDLSPIPLVFLALFPLAGNAAILRFRMHDSDVFLARAATYAILTGLVVASYALIVTGASLIIGNSISADNPVLIGLFVFVLAVALNPLKSWLQQSIDKALFRGRSVYQDKVQEFSRELTQIHEVRDILNKLRQFVLESFFPLPLHIFIFEPLSNHYLSCEDADQRPTTDLRFSTGSALVKALNNSGKPIELENAHKIPAALKAEQNRIVLLAARLFIPLPGQKQLVGWLALGGRQSGVPYSSREIEFLVSLCTQAALAIERMQVIANLERRVREMDVLARIAQGINFTLEFDDMLELIYAQTNQVIPFQDFRVTLRKVSQDGYYHAIYIENDERINDRESGGIPDGQGLETLVVRKQKPILTEDYERECRNRGVIPESSHVYAWVSVPMNAGADTIGAISLGSRDPTVLFSEQQEDLLQAIADQTAGAIVKANLLAETKKRARELNTLNEITRSLTSTLEIKPLLSQILNNATQILLCEAGSLFLLDENTGELIFEVTVGPVADDLVGRRLPPGTGLAGRVAARNEPMIANNAPKSQNWSSSEDKQTGFITRDILAVPMMVKEKTIGVIEVINKRDGSTFTQDDLELLSTFSSQAAIAIENARLYTQTDEALSARLDEMSVMQRIDRELNASLDVARTMHIALSWSMDQTHADAGFIGFVDEGKSHRVITVIASEGYSVDAPMQELDGGFPLGGDGHELADMPLIRNAIHEGKPQRDVYHPGYPAYEEEKHHQGMLLPNGLSQVAIPIRRKSDVIGILVLESKVPDQFPDEIVTFLTRLSDHAAIAISNALLYADLQTANIAKSEFVSLVSHELKTPMTSIRGYTDLLIQGTVGPINEIQANFLNTIRSNVNRMANLVSDLADVSRIEAGRLRLEFGEVAIDDVVNEVAISVQAQIAEKAHHLEKIIPEGLPHVWGDFNRLIQVMNNLVSNAIKYTSPNGHIKIYAEYSANKWDEQGAPEVVHIAVSDDGFGISTEDQEKIFQKFFRSGDPNIRDQSGTGLGLNITRHLVEMQGGCIWFDTAAGKGSTFHITIPVAATT